jgi:hypothetical protein
MIRKPDSRHNLHSVHSTLQPLGVECMQCQHRAALARDKIGAHAGNMKEVRELSFKCPALATSLGSAHQRARCTLRCECRWQSFAAQLDAPGDQDAAIPQLLV